MEQLGCHWTEFHEICYFIIFRKPVEKIQLLLKSNKNNSTLHDDVHIFVIISRWILLRMRNVPGKICRENQNTHFMPKFLFFPLKSCRLWDNGGKYGRARQATCDSIIRRMRFACWIIKPTVTYSEYTIFISYSRQLWLRERIPVLDYRCIACVVHYLGSWSP
jgi:hypothetical protein